jgi:hypothetical protein
MSALESTRSARPAAPTVVLRLPSSRWLLALTILTGQITLAFSMFAVAVALPNIMSAMSADVTNIHWVMTGFQIARTVPMPAPGWFSSLLGHRTLYITGLAITVGATICCGLEPGAADFFSRAARSGRRADGLDRAPVTTYRRAIRVCKREPLREDGKGE